MYQKILVPLDGSKLAECAIPYAEELARGCSTEEIILISVTERVRGQTQSLEAREVYRASDDPEVQRVSSGVEFYRAGDELEVQKVGSEITVTLGKKERQALRYLGRTARRLEAKGVQVRTDVLLGKPAEEIVSFAESNGADIIVMSSHGRSGPSRWAYGSVADKVLRASCIPVLTVRAPGCMPGI